MHSKILLVFQTNFHKHNRDDSQFLFHTANSNQHRAGLVSRRLEFLEEWDNSPCLAVRQPEPCFQSSNSS